MMGKVILNDIRVYAFHGCMEEEERIGSDYIVNLEVETDMQKPAESDLLEDAVDYVVGVLQDTDSWVGVAGILAVVFIIPAELLKVATLGLCGYLIFKPNVRKKLLGGK